MPTLQDWLVAMIAQHDVVLDSSGRLAASVDVKQQARTRDLLSRGKQPPAVKRPLLGLPALQAYNRIPVRPVELLLSLGRITTPPIPNLVDITSTWALIRYVWAFRPPSGASRTALTLSREARDLDFHQKALLSDEIGIALAHYLMTNYLRCDTHVDVSYALRTSSYHVRPNGRARPDYLFFNEVSGSKYVVECKGTQTSRSESMHQLQRGTEQVLGIRPTDGISLTRIVIATCMLEKGTHLYVLDPPDNESENRRYSEEVWRPHGPSFRRDVRLIAVAKMLAFAGFNAEAFRLLPDSLRKGLGPSAFLTGPVRTIESELGEFDGTTTVFALQGGTRVELFKGLLAHTRRSFARVMPEESDWLSTERVPIEIPSAYSSGFAKESHRVYHRLDETLQVQCLCRDGTMIQVSISGTM